jgi:hypothetical protein
VSHIKVPNGIDFGRLPSFDDKKQKYYVIKQLGFGAHGVCCLAITQNASVACVIKFFHPRTDIALEPIDVGHAAAKQEADMWEKIYGSTYNFSAKSFDFPTRTMLVMPCIRIPRNCEERKALVVGEDDSLLYLALDLFSKQGYAHPDIYWHHVGTFTFDSPEKKVEALCDLGGLVELPEAKRATWVNESFSKLKNRIGKPDSK